jgi:hypothetical protein
MELMDVKPAKKIKLYNGPLECLFAGYQLYHGQRKEGAAKPIRRRIMRDGSTSVVE